MSTKFKTRINAKPAKGEVQLNRELLTRPDGAKSMSEILKRFAQGIPLSGRSNPVFNESWEYPDLSHMDLVEIDDLKEEMSRTVNVRRKAVMEKHLKDKKLDDDKKRKELEDSIRKELLAGERGGDKKSSSDVPE